MTPRGWSWDPDEDIREALEEWDRVVEAQDMAMARRDRLADHAPTSTDYEALEAVHRHEEALMEWASRIAQNAGPKVPSDDVLGALQ